MWGRDLSRLVEDVGLSGFPAPIYDDCVSLVYIIASGGCASRLPCAAQRIRQNIRCTDTVLLLDHTCAIVLPATPLQGAQAVARRVATLLVDVDCELQTFYGLSALTIWQRLQSESAIEVRTRSTENATVALEPPAPLAGVEITQTQATVETNNVSALSAQRIRPVPYLAFLAHYPSRQLLHSFPYELACRYHCIPVGAERNMLTIGVGQCLDDAIIAHFEQVTRCGIFQVRCEARMIDEILRYWQRFELENITHDTRTLSEPESVRQLI